ncbi:MAG: MEKHLA domain-containing protein [Chromatiaceae bacterium]
MRIPSPANDFQVDHSERLRRTYQVLTGRHLLDPALSPAVAAEVLFHAPFVVLSHDTAADPILNYGNLAALNLFAMSWEEFTAMPSRLTAEASLRAERERLLAEVAARGYIDDYAGVRIAKTGARFRIAQATVWNLSHDTNQRYGQAATFRQWRMIRTPVSLSGSEPGKQSAS